MKKVKYHCLNANCDNFVLVDANEEYHAFNHKLLCKKCKERRKKHMQYLEEFERKKREAENER